MPGSHITGTNFVKVSKKIIKNIRSKGIFSSLLFAFALWFYVSMNNVFTMKLYVPLILKTNENQSIVSEVPSKIEVEIKGKGWNLINAKFFYSSYYCLLKIDNLESENNQINLTYSKLLNSIKNLEKFEIKSINPENLNLILGNIDQVLRKIKSNIEIHTRNGFTIVNTKMNPEEVVVKGSLEKIKDLLEVPTRSKILEDVYKNMNGLISFADTLYPSFNIKPNYTKYNINIQFKCDLSYKQIPVKVRGGLLPADNEIKPGYITVYLTGGVEELANINPSELVAYVNFEDLMDDSTGILVPEISLPSNVTLMKTEPPYLYHFKYSQKGL
ncbi:MAG: hypothetical protein A2X64_01345 [Ignavibacteria bacterium GWF2_33_9]|nr:MAG: hypothetical protein A2X64_01345 [Ignavibacteria bacterium GWF2_33_9]